VFVLIQSHAMEHKCFLASKLYQKIGGHVLIAKFGQACGARR